MKTILLSSGLGFVNRGIEIWMLDLFQHWSTESGSVELWSGGTLKQLNDPRYRCLGGISRDHAWVKHRPWAQRYLWEQWSVLPRSIWRLKRSQADVVYCGDPVLTWHLKRFQRLHGASVVFMNGMRLSPQWGNHLDGVHLLADPYLEEANAELGSSKSACFFAVPHFADTDTFRPATPDERLEARREFGLPLDRFLVLSVGPLGNVSGKRLEFLAREVAASHPTAHLVHAGVEEDGATAVRQEVGRALGNRITFLGPVAREKMPRLYHTAEVYSLGSLAEPFSIAILEALASGLPVVHHKDRVMQWQSGAGGRSVNMEAAGEAAAVFRELIEESGVYQVIRKNARRMAQERYSAPSLSQRIGEELAKVRAQSLARQSA